MNINGTRLTDEELAAFHAYQVLGSAARTVADAQLRKAAWAVVRLFAAEYQQYLVLGELMVQGQGLDAALVAVTDQLKAAGIAPWPGRQQA